MIEGWIFIVGIFCGMVISILIRSLADKRFDKKAKRFCETWRDLEYKQLLVEAERIVNE